MYDGWETRRRREPGHDYAIVRLGVPGIVRGVVVDTAWFTGNYPPYASVEADGRWRATRHPTELLGGVLGDAGRALAAAAATPATPSPSTTARRSPTCG